MVSNDESCDALARMSTTLVNVKVHHGKSCDTLARMSTNLVNIKVHHGNRFINYCDSGVDLSQFQYVDINVSSPLHMRHANLLSWMHNFLQVDPS